MQGKSSAELPFNAEIERTFHARCKQARLVRQESKGCSDHSGSKSEEEKPMAEEPPPPERILGDYGGANAPAGRLTIVNQPVNIANFQLHPSIIRLLENRYFTRKIKEDANKHL